MLVKEGCMPVDPILALAIGSLMTVGGRYGYTSKMHISLHFKVFQDYLFIPFLKKTFNHNFASLNFCYRFMSQKMGKS
jgi:hypothetical protein